jgi:hypothetical protein
MECFCHCHCIHSWHYALTQGYHNVVCHHWQLSLLWLGSFVLTENKLWREDDHIDIFVDYCVL